jgi:hypothetical protein
VEDFCLSESMGKTNYEVGTFSFLFFYYRVAFENVMDVCRYSARKRKEGKKLRKENRRVIKPRSC